MTLHAIRTEDDLPNALVALTALARRWGDVPDPEAAAIDTAVAAWRTLERTGEPVGPAFLVKTLSWRAGTQRENQARAPRPIGVVNDENGRTHDKIITVRLTTPDQWVTITTIFDVLAEMAPLAARSFLLHHLVGLTWEEVGDDLNVDASSAYRWAESARLQLQEALT